LQPETCIGFSDLHPIPSTLYRFKGGFLLHHFFQQQFRLYAASPAQRQHTGLHRAFRFHPAAIQQKNTIQQGEARIVLIAIQNDNFKWLIFSIDFFEELGVII